jgi:hypothetical protein
MAQDSQFVWPETERRSPGYEIGMLRRLVVSDLHAEIDSLGNAILIFD